VAKWNHARKGIIEGTIIREDDEWVDIELSRKTRAADWPDPFKDGFRPVYASTKQVLRVRKSLLTEVDVDGSTRDDKNAKGN